MDWVFKSSCLPFVFKGLIFDLLIQHLRRVLPTLFTTKKLHQWNRQISGKCSKRPARRPVHQPLSYPLTPYLLLHQLIQLGRLQKTDKRTLMTLNRMQMQYFSDYLCSPSIGAVTKKITFKKLGQHKYHPKIQHLSSPILVGLTDFSVVLFPKLNTSYRSFKYFLQIYLYETSYMETRGNWFLISGYFILLECVVVAQSWTPSHQFWCYQTTSTSCRWGQS